MGRIWGKIALARELPMPLAMSKDAFANAMNQIAAQSQAEKEREVQAERRQQLYAKLRSGIAALMLMGLLAAGFSYRAEVQQFVSETILSKPKVGQIDGRTGEALKGIQAQADKRDQVLSEITK